MNRRPQGYPKIGGLEVVSWRAEIDAHNPEGLSWLAVEVLEKNSTVADSIQLLVVDGFDSFIGAQRKALQLLAPQVNDLLVTFPGEANSHRPAYRRFTRTLEKLIRELSPQITSVPDSSRLPPDLLHIENLLFETSEEVAKKPEAQFLYETRSPGEEAREALRWIKVRVVRDGVPLNECAIFTPNSDLYNSFLRISAIEFGIPAHFTRGTALTATSAIAALLNLLALPAQKFKTRLLFNALRSLCWLLWSSAQNCVTKRVEGGVLYCSTHISGSSMINKILLWLQDCIKHWTRPATLTLTSGLLSDFTRSRMDLMAENAMLRQQLIVLNRQIKRTQLTSSDRFRLVFLSHFTKLWKGSLHMVHPDTLLRWHRELFRMYWRQKSQGKPRISPETIGLIQKMARENPLWGAERIHGGLLKLGIAVSKRSIQKYILKERRSHSSGQSWATFLKNQANEIWACDFTVACDWLFRQWYIFVLIELKTHRIAHTGVTRFPTDEWTAQQLREARPWGKGPKYLVRDRDKKICHALCGSGRWHKHQRVEDAVSDTTSEWDLRKVHRQPAQGMPGSYSRP